MSVYTDLAAVSARIAVIPSILRTRGDDVARLERNGSLNGDMEAKVAAHVKQLRKIASDLEKAIA